MLPLLFSASLFADAPVVDLTQSSVKYSANSIAPILTMEQRLSILERKMNNNMLMELYQQVDALQMEVQQLRGAQDESQYALTGVKKRQRDLYVDLDQRISSMQLTLKGLVAAPLPVNIVPPIGVVIDPANVGDVNSPSVVDEVSAPQATSAGLLVVGGVDVAPAGAEAAGNSQLVAVAVDVAAAPLVVVLPINPLQEQGDYQIALDLLMAGNNEQAISAFLTFLSQYPQGEFAMNAQYWLGEAYYVTGKFDQAIESFNRVAETPAARKRPDAMLKIGYSFYELKRWVECRGILQKLIAEFPGSAAAGLAEQRLEMLRAANL